MEESRIAPTGERMPWHRPEVSRLNVTLDTREGVGSYPDFLGGEATSPVSR